MNLNWASFGFSRATALLPRLHLGKPLLNAEKLIPHFQNESKGSSVITTPEMGLTGYTCEDLFHSEALIQESEEALKKILDASKGHLGIWVVGAPLRLGDGRLFNGAYVFSRENLGLCPKTFLPNMGEFYERRWFVSGRNLNEEVNHSLLGTFFASRHQIFAGGPIRVGIEICQDLWSPESPSTELALKGANLILNLSASNELVGKPEFRRKLVEVQSQKSHCAYLYTSSGMGESSKDTVFSGHTFACELGIVLSESKPFETSPADTFTVDFDLEKVLNSRSKDMCFLEAVEYRNAPVIRMNSFAFNTLPLTKLTRDVEAYPFLAEIFDLEEVLSIQSQGLLRRLTSANSKAMILGVSGGLDSTLALLVATRVRD